MRDRFSFEIKMWNAWEKRKRERRRKKSSNVIVERNRRRERVEGRRTTNSFDGFCSTHSLLRLFSTTLFCVSYLVILNARRFLLVVGNVYLEIRKQRTAFSLEDAQPGDRH